MKYIFQKLTDFLSEHGLDYSVSATVEKKDLGQIVIVGGEVKFASEDYSPKAGSGNWYVELDDGVGVVRIYLVAPIFEAFKGYIKIGNIILIKGRIAEKTTKSITTRYVAGTSIELVEEGKS